MKKKIAIIGAKGLPAKDGISRVVECYIPYLTAKYDITIYCTEAYAKRASGDYNGYHEIVLKSIHNTRLNSLWYYIKACIHALFCAKYDLIHFHHCDSAFLYPLLKLKYGDHIMVTTHGAFHDKLNDKWKKYEWYFKLQYNYFLKTVNHSTSVSKEEKRKGEKIIGKPIVYIPNGINISEPVSPQIVGQNYIFFAAGRIMEIKGLDLLLDACNQLKYQGVIKVAGDMTMTPASYKTKIMEKAKGLNVEFLGMIHDKSLLLKYLQNSALFVFPSRVEALSMQLLEGVSMKAHTIASDIKANTDVFSSEEMLFFHTENVKDLQEKIMFAMSHPTTMDALSTKAIETLKEKYSWDIIAKQYDEQYEQILN